MTMEAMAVRKEAIEDLVKIRDELNAVVESMELMSDKEFMRSYRKAMRQVKERDFGEL